ncbi:MAG: EF-hand domain-containing protein [Pseudomonadota bacterium]
MLTNTKAPVIALVLAALPLSVNAQDGTVRPPANHDEGRAYAEQLADAIDIDRDGTIQDSELLAFAEVAFRTVDVDESGTMSEAEMVGWRYGMKRLAIFREREQAYRTTIALVFDIFDENNDGQVDRDEHVAAVQRSAAYADYNGNGLLERDEYLSGFIFNVAMRAALVTEDMR